MHTAKIHNVQLARHSAYNYSQSGDANNQCTISDTTRILSVQDFMSPCPLCPSPLHPPQTNLQYKKCMTCILMHKILNNLSKTALEVVKLRNEPFQNFIEHNF